MKKARIITHCGKAHRDDYLACCCAVWHEYSQFGRLSTIERRIPGSSDLECGDTWVIDVGGRWEAELLNFDHHQSDPSLLGMCALDLVLKHLLSASAYTTYRTVSPWLRLTAVHDTHGATAAAEQGGMDLRAYMSTRSPIERAALARFAELPVIHPESPMMHTMRDTGRMLLTEASNISVGIPDALMAAPPPFEHAGLRVWDIRSVNLDGDTISTALVNQASSSKGVDVVVSHNTRTGGVGIYRQTWATHRMDLGKVADHARVRFVHKNGFYAVLTQDVTDNELMEMLATSALPVTV